jgi:hypothetical protein
MSQAPIGVMVLNKHTSEEQFKIYQEYFHTHKTIEQWVKGLSESVIYRQPCFICDRGDTIDGAEWNLRSYIKDPNVINFMTSPFFKSEGKIILDPKNSISTVEGFAEDGKPINPKQTLFTQIVLCCDECMNRSDWFDVLKKKYPPESDCTFVDLRGQNSNK